MSAITASQVKDLRERTGLGMMECKKALVTANGDIELAIDNLRKSSGLKAAKKADRTAAEGIVAAHFGADRATLVEINCETDFVARDENFLAFAKQIVEAAGTSEASVDDLLVGDLAKTREELVQRIGENITVRRIARVPNNGVVAGYVHGNNKVAALVSLDTNNQELGKDVAMHIVATSPQAIYPEDVSAELIEKEKEIFTAQAKESGKPAEIIEKMIHGRVNKFLAEISLVKQPFVKNPDTTVGALLQEAGCKVLSFVRFEVGEGIEKQKVDFAEEVRQQAGV